jgi:hypothetical protein
LIILPHLQVSAFSCGLTLSRSDESLPVGPGHKRSVGGNIVNKMNSRLLLILPISVLLVVASPAQPPVHADDKLFDQLVTIKGKVQIQNHPQLGKTPGSFVSILFQFEGCKKCLFVARTDADGTYEIGVGRGRYRVIKREARGGGSPSYDMLSPDQPRYVDATSVLKPTEFDIKILLAQPIDSKPD